MSEIWIYPIKGCKGFKVNDAKVTPRGFEFDRLFMLVHGDNEIKKFISQRTNPKMALIHTAIDYTKAEVAVSAAGIEASLVIPCHAPADQTATPTMASVWGQECEVLDQGDAASKWFSDFLGCPNIRMVCVCVCVCVKGGCFF